MQHVSENKVSSVSGSELQVAWREQALDELLESVSHLFCYVTKDGIIRTVTGLSKDCKLIQLDQAVEKDSGFVTGKPPVEKSAAGASRSRKIQGHTLDAVMPWLWDDVKAFLLGGAERADFVKSINGMGGDVEYHIRLGSVVSADGAVTGAILSILAQSEIGRVARDRQKLDLFEETLREIRVFCHDFSQPLMVLSGYLELIGCAQSGEPKCLRTSQIEGLEREMHKVGGIYQKLRDAVIHCRRQMELIDSPPAI